VSAPFAADRRSFQDNPAHGLLARGQFDGVCTTVLGNNPGMTRHSAERIVVQALAFVVSAARFPSMPLAPSRVVDEGWHALILHTRTYRALCQRLGRFVHHSPGYDPTHYDPEIIDRTLAVIEATGFTVDKELWGAPTVGLIPVAARCQHAPECAIEPMPEPRPPGGGGGATGD
jgi:hypothetical protein